MVKLVKLVKRVKFNREIIERIITPFIDDFISRVDMDKVITLTTDVAGSVAGKTIFSQATGVNLGKAIVSQGVASYIAGFSVGGFLLVGAEVSRSIYTSRYLRERNPAMYVKLNKMGDYDLFYYLIEDVVRPYEKACEISEVSPEEFNRICKFFFGGL